MVTSPYTLYYIIRFEGTLTQGPNAGKSYTFRTSWGGVLFASLAAARTALVKYKDLEPGLAYKVCSRQHHDGPGVTESEVGE
jgi:hypothetical protein